MTFASTQVRASAAFRAAIGAAFLALVVPLAGTPAHAAFPGSNGPMLFEHAGDIYVRTQNGTTTNLTGNLSTPVYNPAITPDNAWIAFDDGTFMYTMRRNGTGRRKLIPTNAQLGICVGAVAPAWSPSGARIAFTCQRAFNNNGGSDIYTMKRDGSGYLEIGTTGGADMAAWSPNGRKIAWTDNGRIYMALARGGGEQMVHGDPPSPNGPGGSWQYIDWAPDGQHLIAENLIIGLYTVPAAANSEGQEEFILEDGSATQPVYAPNGARILFSDVQSPDSDFDLYSVRLDGTGRRKVTNMSGGERTPEWAPAP